MSHQTFKVSIIIDDSVENFYIKHFVDEYQPIFNKFKNLVFQRNPCVNSPILKIYWIDSENDKILISCEEDFRLYIEQGHGKKIFFSVVKGAIQQQEEEDEASMEAEESKDRHKSDRRSRKSTRDEEKQKRASKRLAEKMRSAEEKVRSEAERHSKCSEKYERKNAERLERAKKRCEQIRQIIGAFDPANLGTSSEVPSTAGSSTNSNASAIPPAVSPVIEMLRPCPENFRLLSNAIIAGCLQPANIINKILGEIIQMIPVVPIEGEAQTSAQSSNDQQQQTETARQNTATNTSDVNTNVNTPIGVNPNNAEIVALFKEAAKELEKMNEIVNSSKSMESSTISAASSNSAITQIEQVVKNLADSVKSNSTIINIETSEQNEEGAQADSLDGRAKSPEIEESFKMVSPPKSVARSRESSIEVHDVNSMMSDDSRDWTMLDAVANEHDDEDVSFASASVYPSLPATPSVKQPEAVAEANKNSDSMKSVSNETPIPSLSNVAGSSLLTQEEVRASIQESIKSVGELSEIVRNSVESAQRSLNNVQQPKTVAEQAQSLLSSIVAQAEASARVIDSERKATSVASQATPVSSSVAAQATQTTDPKPVPVVHQIWPTAPSQASSETRANLMANRHSTGAKPKSSQSVPEPALIVYDPNPKINEAVHVMIRMGFSNEGGWLTQLLLNVDGDIPKAINFLTPQPKNQPK